MTSPQLRPSPVLSFFLHLEKSRCLLSPSAGAGSLFLVVILLTETVSAESMAYFGLTCRMASPHLPSHRVPAPTTCPSSLLFRHPPARWGGPCFCLARFSFSIRKNISPCATHAHALRPTESVFVSDFSVFRLSRTADTHDTTQDTGPGGAIVTTLDPPSFIFTPK